MYNGKYVLAIIPARGGSTRLPGKNLAEIYNGMSLIAYGVHKLSQIAEVDQIVVSTDDQKIMDHVFNLKRLPNGPPITIHHRSDEASDDGAPIMQVVREVVKGIPAAATGYLLVHQIDHPCTTVWDFRRAIKRMDDDPRAGAVITVDSVGNMTGSARFIRADIVNKLCMEYIVDTIRTEYPQVDIHYEGDLAQAMSEVAKIEMGAGLLGEIF